MEPRKLRWRKGVLGFLAVHSSLDCNPPVGNHWVKGSQIGNSRFESRALHRRQRGIFLFKSLHHLSVSALKRRGATVNNPVWCHLLTQSRKQGMSLVCMVAIGMLRSLSQAIKYQFKYKLSVKMCLSRRSYNCSASRRQERFDFLNKTH